jgi:glycosyltransferase involved in cell wall biosynthesis
MTLLMIWHAGTVPQYQDRYLALEEYFDEIIVVVPDGWKEVEKYPPPSGVGSSTEVHRLSCWFPFHPYTVLYQGLGTLINERTPNVLYVHEEPLALSAAQAAVHARRTGTPLLVDSALINKIGYAWGVNPVEQLVYSTADVVYYRNDQCRQTLLQRGCSEQKLRGPMPNGVSEQTFFPVPRSEATKFLDEVAGADGHFMRQESTLSHGRPLRLGFAGRICYEKGVDLLCRIPSLEEDLEVVLCGPMIDAKYRRLLQESSDLYYLGELDGGDMNKFYSACDLTVLPSLRTSRWEEQFGRVLTESIACETPAVGSDVGMIEQIVGREAVFPERDTEAFARLVDSLRDPNDRESLLAAQKRRVRERFSWSAVGEKVWEDVQSVTQSGTSM